MAARLALFVNQAVGHYLDSAFHRISPCGEGYLLRQLFIIGTNSAKIDSKEPKKPGKKIVECAPQASASFNYFIYFERIEPFYRYFNCSFSKAQWTLPCHLSEVSRLPIRLHKQVLLENFNSTVITCY